MKKKCLILILLQIFLCSFNIFAYGGILSGQKELRVSVTKWFDIIYPSECQTTATILYYNLDQVYEDVCAEYGRSPEFRMPIVITPENESFNAYYSSYPYHRIVLYDTTSIESLDVFTEELLSTVKHEITHAVSLNTTSDFMKGVQKIFGDSVSLDFWLTSRGMAEGATVSMESSSGEGRVNSEFETHFLKQAKIENNFPDYYDVQCSSDVLPYNDFYIFNGVFYSWLQKKYGMEKYAQLWFDCINMQAIDFGTAFENVYGTQVRYEWNLFKEQLQVPQVNPNPVQAGLSKDFFEYNGSDYSRKNDSGRNFTKLISGKKGIAYLDSESNSVFYISNKDLFSSENGTNNPKKLFSLRNVRDIKFSNDGNFLTAIYFSIEKSNLKKAIMIYNLETGKSFYATKEASEEGVILENNGDYYFVYNSFSSNYNRIKIAKVELTEKKEIKSICLDEEKIVSIDLPFEVKPYSFVALPNGRFAFILKNKLSFSVCVCNIYGSIEKCYEQPGKKYVMRYLSLDSQDENILNFTWVKENSLPRLGNINLKNGEYNLQKDDISGGIFYPVSVLQGKNQKIIYIGSFYKQSRLLVLNNKGDLEKINARQQNIEELLKKQKEEDSKKYAEIEYEKYNSFKYYQKGLLIPYSSLYSQSYAKDSSIASSLPIGLSYSSSNPWEDNEITATLGYGLETNSIGLDFSLFGGTGTNLFLYNFELFSEFDMTGFKQLFVNGNCSSTIPVGKKSKFILSAGGKFWFGKANYLNPEKSFVGKYESVNSEKYIYAYENASISFSNIIKTGPGRNQFSGFSLTAALMNKDNFSVTGEKWNSETTEIGFYSSIYIPNLIPIECKRTLIYNLPVKIKFNLFIPNSVEGTSNLITDLLYELNSFYEPTFTLAGMKTEVILFGTEIQNPIPAKSFLWIYLHDFHISFLYSLGFNRPLQDKYYFSMLKTPSYIEAIQNNEIQLQQYFGLRFFLGFQFNFGLGSKTSLCFDVYMQKTTQNLNMALSFDVEF